MLSKYKRLTKVKMIANPILEKNLEIIEKYNPSLKEKLLSLSSFENNIEFIETELKELNLSYNDLPIHAKSGAVGEARAYFEKSGDGILSTHFILGFGFGYLIKEFSSRSRGKIVVYEPNLEILRIALEKEDFSRELSRGNMWVVSDGKELKSIYPHVYVYKADIKFSILDSYRKILGLKAQEMLDEIKVIDGGFLVDFNHMKNNSFQHLDMIMGNLPYMIDSTPLIELKDIYKDKTAVVISAGPTLDLNIETIKKYRDKFIIFCVGTAVKTLYANDIKPDFLNIAELFNCSSQIKGLDLSDIDMIIEPSTNLSFYRAKVKQKFIFPPGASVLGQYWCNLTNVYASDYMTKGTVSYQALLSAKILGFKKIILVGQDLAFLNNSCYSKDSAYSDLVFEINPETNKHEFKTKDYEKFLKEITPEGVDPNEQWCQDFVKEKLKILAEQTVFVKGITGKMLPTEADYSLFIENFVEFADKNKNLELINTSMIGAQLDGFENMELEKALNGAEKVDKITINPEYKFDKNLIVENLRKDRQLLEAIIEKIEEGIFNLSKFERAMATTAFSTPEAHQSFEKVMQVYDVLRKEYFNRCEMFILISFTEEIELQYTFKNGIDLGVESKISSLYPVIKNYFDNVQEKILILMDKIEKNIDILSK